jgi:Flp pilus assembly protein TadD
VNKKPDQPPEKSEPTERIPVPPGSEKPREAPWDPARVIQFIHGHITLGELQEISKEEQYKIAEVGYRFFTEGKLDNARKVFEGLIALDPRDAYFNTVLGSIAQQKGELERAEQLYTRALQINPFSAVAYANRGEVRLLRGNLLEAAKDLKRALEEDPQAREKATQRAKFTIKAVLTQIEATQKERLQQEGAQPAVEPAPASTPAQAQKTEKPKKS